MKKLLLNGVSHFLFLLLSITIFNCYKSEAIDYDLAANVIVSPRTNIAPIYLKYTNNSNIKIIGAYTNEGVNPINKFKAIYKIYNQNEQIVKEGFINYDDQVPPYTTINSGETIEVVFDSFFKTNDVGVYKIVLSADWVADQNSYNNKFPRNDTSSHTFEVQYDIQLAANKVIIPTQGEKLLTNKSYTPIVEFINKGISPVSYVLVGMKIVKLSNNEVVYQNSKNIEDLSSGRFNTISMEFEKILLPELGDYKVCSWIYDAEDPIRSDDTTCVTFEVVKPLFDIEANSIISPKTNTAPYYMKYLNNSNIRLLGTYTNKGLNPINKFNAFYRIYNQNGNFVQDGYINYDDSIPPYTTIYPDQTVEVDFHSFFKTNEVGVYKMEISSYSMLDSIEVNNVYSRLDSPSYTFEVTNDIQVATNKLLIPFEGKKIIFNTPILPKVEFINKGISVVSNVIVGMKVIRLSNGEVVYQNSKIIDDLPSGRYNTIAKDFDLMMITQAGAYQAISWIYEPDDLERSDDTTFVNFEVIMPPKVTSVTVPYSRSYLENEELIFNVNWDENVTVTGNPQLALTIGLSTKYASYTFGYQPNSLRFRYLVTQDDLDADGIEIQNLILNDGTIKFDTTFDVSLTLNSIEPTSGVLVGVKPPEVRTDNPTNRQATTVTLNGEVISDGHLELLSKGFVISSTESNPDLYNAGTYSDIINEIGMMSKNINGLKSSTNYYYRAFATNSQGTSYGDVFTFTTLAPEPTRQTKSISFYKLGKTVLGLKWTKGNGSKRIIVASTNNLSDATYVKDGQDYEAGIYGIKESEVAGTYVVYNNNGNIFDVTGLTNNTTYFFRIFDYNGQGLTANYNLNSAASNPRSNKTLKKEIDDTIEQGVNFNLNIYPNPAKDNINIELNLPFERGEMIIVDNEGREVYKTTDLSKLINLDIRDFVNGTYHILISNGDEAIYNSFVINR